MLNPVGANLMGANLMGANLMGVNDATTGHALVERHQRIGTALDKPPKDRHMAVKKPALGRF